MRPDQLRPDRSRVFDLRGKVERRFRGVPFGTKPTWLEVAIPRVGCQGCGALRQVRLPPDRSRVFDFAEARVSSTRTFERSVVALCRYMSMLDVARPR